MTRLLADIKKSILLVEMHTIDRCHNSKASFPVMQLAHLMATSLFSKQQFQVALLRRKCRLSSHDIDTHNRQASVHATRTSSSLEARQISWLNTQRRDLWKRVCWVKSVAAKCESRCYLSLLQLQVCHSAWKQVADSWVVFKERCRTVHCMCTSSFLLFTSQGMPFFFS